MCIWNWSSLFLIFEKKWGISAWKCALEKKKIIIWKNEKKKSVFVEISNWAREANFNIILWLKMCMKAEVIYF